MNKIIEEIKKIDNGWCDFLTIESTKPYFIELSNRIEDEFQNYLIHPGINNIFNAFKMCDLKDIKVVIIGQDPYHEVNQAHGLAFSVQNNICPPSLVNIFKSLEIDLGIHNTNPDLTNWAKSGILLLNRILTVRNGEALSHKNLGWENFTENVIKYLNSLDQPLLFVLWGNEAIKLKKYITNKEYINSAHPSPLSVYRGFFEKHNFIQINNFISQHHLKPINWSTDVK